ncbi:hypothetical protein [Vaginisenegalia massiliensis]|uniref:hypothetical protein n=1 Tax=Vaginisenegalia massiliensis TaxID=2058294 RepID=UPI000F541E2D|nr:hypothetical protein [Vaginisenegalia massiliensis]
MRLVKFLETVNDLGYEFDLSQNEVRIYQPGEITKYLIARVNLKIDMCFSINQTPAKDKDKLVNTIFEFAKTSMQDRGNLFNLAARDY